MQNAQTETESAPTTSSSFFFSISSLPLCSSVKSRTWKRTLEDRFWSRRVQGGNEVYDIREQTGIQDMPRRQPTHRSSNRFSKTSSPPKQIITIGWVLTTNWLMLPAIDSKTETFAWAKKQQFGFSKEGSGYDASLPKKILPVESLTRSVVHTKALMPWLLVSLGLLYENGVGSRHKWAHLGEQRSRQSVHSRQLK